MPTTELILQQKTILHHFPEFEDFYNEVRKVIEKVNLITDNEEEALFYTYTYCVYDKWKLNIHYNQSEVFLSKLWSGMVAKFFTLRKRERLWNNIFAHISLELNKLVELKTSEYIRDDRTKYLDTNKIATGDYDRTIINNSLERGESREAQRITNSEKPYSTIDLLHGDYGNIANRADWLSTEAIMDGGYIGIEKDKEGNPVLGEDGKPVKILNPNWNKRTNRGRNKDTSQKHDKFREDSKETDRGTIDKTIYQQEQPILIQQLARIIPSYSLVESDLEDFTDFSYLFHTVWVPQGEFIFNSNTWQWDYITREEIKKIEEEKQGKIKLPRIRETDADLSFDEWQELYNEQEVAIMPTWYLERIYRYKKRIDKKTNKDETDQARLEIIFNLGFWNSNDNQQSSVNSRPRSESDNQENQFNNQNRKEEESNEKILIDLINRAKSSKNKNEIVKIISLIKNFSGERYYDLYSEEIKKIEIKLLQINLEAVYWSISKIMETKKISENELSEESRFELNNLKNKNVANNVANVATSIINEIYSRRKEKDISAKSSTNYQRTNKNPPFLFFIIILEIIILCSIILLKIFKKKYRKRIKN